MARRHHFVRAVACVVAAFVLPFTSPGSAHAFPSSNTLPTDPAPPGANDPGCTLSPERPRPIVLVHGTGIGMLDTWSEFSPRLAAEGFCVYALNYGGAPEIFPPHRISWGVGDITESAAELAKFVDEVLAHTGADQVDIVGHSQGGVTARQYIGFNGGADPSTPDRNKVGSLVTLGTPHTGTTFGTLLDMATTIDRIPGAGSLLVQSIWGPAGVQQLSGSSFLNRLNSLGTFPGIRYIAIASTMDEVITPAANAFIEIPGPRDNVQNIWVQEKCPFDQTSHGELVTATRSMSMVSNVLSNRPAITPDTPC